ncbi:EpsG family protein [Gelidibacter japonicus]|nr:EpsG family protein [Gelidibacter japonicus]
MWLFTVFYAATFAIGAENAGSDIVRYVAEVSYLNHLNVDVNGLVAYYIDSGEFDILRTLLAYLVSTFTDNGFYLIIVFGVIYGYFFSRNMWYVLDRLQGRIKIFTKILVICLFLVIPIWNLNGFRFWTGAHIFVFGLLPFLFERKKRSLIWCLITPFVVHYSFIVTLVPLGVYLILGNRIKLYYVVFILSLFASTINIAKFNSFVETYAPENLADRSSSYRSEELVKDLREGEGKYDTDRVWYAKYYDVVLKYTLTAFLLFFYRSFRKTIATNKELLRLLSFILLFYSFANVLSSIPSGFRFLSIANLLTLSFITLYLQNYIFKRDLYRLSKIATPFLLFFILIAFRQSWYSISVMALIGNPITAIMTFGENISLNDIIKSL